MDSQIRRSSPLFAKFAAVSQISEYGSIRDSGWRSWCILLDMAACILLGCPFMFTLFASTVLKLETDVKMSWPPTLTGFKFREDEEADGRGAARAE